MAGRIRTIKPEILEDERSGCLSSDAWRLWVSMWLLADDHGRLRGAPEWLKAQVFWAPIHRGVKVADLLAELDAAGVILRYVVDGQRYIEIRTWSKHQKVDHPGNPRIPLPNEAIREVSNTLARQPENLASDLRSPTSTTTSTSTPTLLSDFDLDEAYAAYPRKEGKVKGTVRAKEQIKSRADFDRLLTAIANYKQSDSVLDGFVMLYSTFMAGRWEDYVSGPVRKKQPGLNLGGERKYKNFDAPRAPITDDDPPETF